MNALTVIEQGTLEHYEAIIERGLGTFIEVGEALTSIRDARLYRAEYDTFEDYCRLRWGMAARHANRLIGAAEVVANLGPMGPILPTSERQTRPMVGLDPEAQREVWERAIDTAPEGRVTGAHVQRVVKEYQGGASQPVEVTIFSHKTVEYYTPPEFLEAAREVLGAIDLDPASCAEAQQNVMAGMYYTKDDDGLSRDWYGRVWLNPPYSKTGGRSNQDMWSEKLVSEYRAGNVTEALLLVKAALGYRWFEELWYDWPVCFVRSRLSFIKEDGDTDGQSKQGTAILYLGDRVDRFIAVFREFGRVILPTDGYSSLC